MGDSHTAMQYRKLPHGQERISVIGLGMGSIHEGSEEEIEQTVRLAMERGVNYFDMVASEEKPVSYTHLAVQPGACSVCVRCAIIGTVLMTRYGTG